jgi:hypothetical protein
LKDLIKIHTKSEVNQFKREHDLIRQALTESKYKTYSDYVSACNSLGISAYGSHLFNQEENES